MPSRTRIKICGLRSQEALQACIQAGADAVGFVLYPPSPRAVDVAQAAQLAKLLPPWVSPVVLLVNPQEDQVQEVIQHIPNALLQFHGDESPAFCGQFKRPFLKAIRMKADTQLSAEAERFAQAQGLLVDSWSEQYGGTGHTFDWRWLDGYGEDHPPLILSGGLEAGNVGEAVKQIQPYGVDVSSGVESQRGVKSLEKIAAFCQAVQAADWANRI